MQGAEFHSYWISSGETEGGSGAYAEHFPYWSFTKTVITICTLKLSEEGMVDLDAYLDGQPFTLRQLLSHTAGLPDYGALADYHRDVAADEEPWPREKVLGAVLTRGGLFAPGQGWSYSNVGYMMAREQIEAASGLSFQRLVNDLVCRPLGLRSIELATTRDQFSQLYWNAAKHYHPGWVYHGCLTGSVRDAAGVLHGLFSGKLLSAGMLDQMLSRHPLGGAIAGRPWTDCGYALGLMSGTMGESGRAIGHSGVGPFSVNAVYHFADRDMPITVACFTNGNEEGPVEFEAARIAQRQ
ncbi:MAG: serine hydrolase domain-containing protein [Geminicoccaceae bacterium]